MLLFNQLKNGDSAKLIGFHEDNEHASKLQTLGLVPGTTVTVVRSAPLGDPIQVNVRGVNLGISRRTAELLILAPF